MPASIFIARLLGPPIAMVGIALLAKPEVYKAILKEFIRSPALIYLAGFFGLLGGLALVLVHNLWVADWRVIITLIGWITIVRGTVTMLWPQWISVIGERLLGYRRLFIGTAVTDVMLGVLLSCYGYLER